MNLFTIIFNNFSRYALDYLVNELEHQMPLHLLQGAMKTNASLLPHQEEIKCVLNYLVTHNEERTFWRNPEVYYPLTQLYAINDASEIESLLLSLKIQLGMVDIRTARPLADGYYRLIHVNGSIFRIDGGQVGVLPEGHSFIINDFRPLFYLPIDGLFNDILSPELYPRLTSDYDTRRLLDLADRAVVIFNNYYAEMSADFTNVIRAIVLTPDIGDSDRWSYNCRLQYFGGIFINPFRVNPYAMVESFIHEYYHQRLWQWWAYEEIEGLPSDKVMVRSPITGNLRSASVMLHALIIYISVLHFYLQQLDVRRDDMEGLIDWIATRASKLQHGIPLLYEELKKVIQPKTTAYSLLDFVGGCRPKTAR